MAEYQVVSNRFIIGFAKIPASVIHQFLMHY